MAIINPKPTTADGLNDKKLDGFQWDAESHRVFLVDSTGTNIDGDNPLSMFSGFNIPEYDDIVLSYTGDNLTGVVYTLLTVTVATLTLSYTGDNLTRVVLS